MRNRRPSSLLLFLLIQILLQRSLREDGRRLIPLEHLCEVFRLSILCRIICMSN